MSFFEKYFERILRKRVKEHEFSFDPSSWEKMEAMLDTNPTTTPLHRSPKYITFIVLSFTTIILSIYYTQTQNTANNQADSNPTFVSQSANTNSPSNLSEFRISESLSSPLFNDFQQKEELLRLGDWMNELWNNALSLHAKTKLANIIPTKNLQGFSQTLSNKVNEYQNYLSEEKVYIHLDRTYFQTGENVWFQVYVRDAVTLKESDKSNVVYVQLIDKTGRIEQTRSLVVKNGIANGDFNLKYKEKGGQFKIRAFTNWQRNREEYFERVFQVEKETNDISFDFEFDKTIYQAEDTVTTQIRFKDSNKSFAGKTVTYSVLVNDKKHISNTTKLDKESIAKLSFKLPSVFANFEGMLQVQIEGSKKRFTKVIPGGCKNIDLQFMPEGGDLIAGYEVNTAFKAINQFGNSVDINGIIYNSKGKKVTTFTAYHSGIGGFSFVPEANEEYYAKITGPSEINEKYFLPEVLSVGYSLKIEERRKNSLGIKALSPRNEKAIIVVRGADNIVLTKTIELKKGWTEIDMETEEWPIGINQITLFDQFYTPQSERLVFVNSNNLPTIEISSDKQVYQPREKVTLNVKVKDANSNPVAGQFSLAVVNKGLIDFSGDIQGNILSYMLLESELKGEIENPNFYFDSAEPKAEKALDYLMMTHGYRRFSWVELDNDPQIALAYPNETSLIKGQILDAADQPIPNAVIEVANSPIRKITDEEGNFMLADLDLSNAIQLNISAKGYPTNWHQVFMYYDDLKLGLNEYPTATRDLTNYPEGVVPPMYPRSSRVVGLEKGVKTVKEVLKTQEKETKVVVVQPKFKTVKKEVQVASGTKNNPPKYRELEEKQMIEGVSTELVTVPALYDTLTKKVNAQETKPVKHETATEVVSYKAKDWKLVKDKNLKHPNYNQIRGNYFKRHYKEQKTGKSYKITEKSISAPATNRIKKVPAEYKTVVRKELIKPEYIKEVVVEAEYKTITNKVLATEATENTPAVYKTVEEKIVVKPAYTTMITVPAEYKEIEEKVETVAAYNISVSKPAEYKIRQVSVSESEYNNYARKFKYGFYRARSFYAPKYSKTTKSKLPDTRKTLHWESNLQLDNKGEAVIDFYNGDELGTFAVKMEGITNAGLPGLGVSDFASKIPVTLDAEIPLSMKVGDKFTLPISISNNLEQTVTGMLNLSVPNGFKMQSDLLKKYSLEGGSTIEVPITFEVVEETSGDFDLKFDYQEFKIRKSAYVNVHNDIYNVLTIGGTEPKTNFKYDIDDLYLSNKDLSLELRIYPNEIAELKDVKQRWENQTNIGLEDEIASLELNLFALETASQKQLDEKDLKEFKRALGIHLENLNAYKHQSGGYTWKKPTIPDLKATALIYAAMYRSSKFIDVDKNEMDAILNWILDNRSENGTWKREENSTSLALSILNALSYNLDINSSVKNTIEKTLKKVDKLDDNYNKALMANVLLKNGDQRGNDLHLATLEKQETTGAWLSKSASMFGKTGRALSLETTALVLENIKISGLGLEYSEKARTYLSENQFILDGQPNYTYLKVKEALWNHLVFNSLDKQDFTLAINGKTVATESVDISKHSNLRISRLDDYLQEEGNSIEVTFEKSGLTHRIELKAKNRVNHSSSTKVQLQLSPDNIPYSLDQEVTEKLKIKNKTDKTIKYPVVIAEIPGGFNYPNQYLTTISENNYVSHIEQKEGKLILYLNKIDPNTNFSLPITFIPKMKGNYKGIQIVLENEGELLGFLTLDELDIEE